MKIKAATKYKKFFSFPRFFEKNNRPTTRTAEDSGIVNQTQSERCGIYTPCELCVSALFKHRAVLFQESREKRYAVQIEIYGLNQLV